MSEILQSRYDQLLRRVADLKGPGSKVNDVLTELFPMIDVENVPAELLALSGSRLTMGTTLTGAGGAGNFSISLLRNNGNSGVIARLIYIQVSSADSLIVIGPTLNSDSANGARAFVDTRVFPEQPSLVTQANNTALVSGPGFMALATDGDGILEYQPPLAIAVIAPGTAFSVGNGTSNIALRVNYLWLERVAQPSELQL